MPAKMKEVVASDYIRYKGEQDCQKCPMLKMKKGCENKFLQVFGKDCKEIEVKKKPL